MRTYTANVTRDDGWWMVSVPEINGLTQATDPSEVERMARSMIAMQMDVPPDSFNITITGES
jgi:predicted RNase H-like HicB family nuclease